MENGKNAQVQFKVFFTLFDGKCVNAIVGNRATSKYPMCLRTAHKFGNKNDTFTPNDTSLELGLGLLHCEIKTFEYLLHISYKQII